MKRFVATLLALVMSLSMISVTAFAAEIEGPVAETIIGGDSSVNQMRAADAPSEYYNLSKTGNYYTAELIDLASQRGSYTRYYFSTGTGKIYLKLNLLRSGTTTDKNRDLIIYLYKKDSATASGTLVDTRTVHFTDAEVTEYKSFTGLDANKFYYIRFYNNSSSKPANSMDISGTIEVDDIYRS